MRSIKLAVTAGLLSTLFVTNAHALTVNGALAIIDRVVAVQMTLIYNLLDLFQINQNMSE